MSKILISDNGVSKVEYDKDIHTYFKTSIPFLIQNEIYWLKRMYRIGYSPKAWLIDESTFGVEAVYPEPITDAKRWNSSREHFLKAMMITGVRHGDLTQPHVIPVGNSPMVIDWAESRLYEDPRPDKRREGDEYWSKITWERILHDSEKR